MTTRPLRSYLPVASAILIAGVLVSASLFFAISGMQKAATITNTQTTTSTSTVTVTTTTTSIPGSTNTVQTPSLQTVASIPIANPSGSAIRIAFDASNGYLYVANGTSSPSITVVDLAENDSIIANIPLGNATGGLLYDPSNGYVYVSQGCLEIVHYGTRSNQTELDAGITAVVINGTKVVKEITGPCASGELAYDPSDHRIFEASVDGGNPNGLVNVIDDRSNTIVASIPVDGGLTGIAYDSSDGMVYVADLSSGSVDVINPATNGAVDVINVESGHPVYADDLVAYNPVNNLVYVTNGITYGYNTELNGTTVVGNFTVPCSGGIGSEFDGFAFDSARGFSFMSACGTVVASNGFSNAALVSVNVPGASSLAYDPSNYELFVVASTGITVLSTTDV